MDTQQRLVHARPESMNAIVIEGKKAKLVHDRPLPRLRDDYVLVKTTAAALNPTDWKHIAYQRAKDGCIIGCDFAGVVEEVGKNVTKSWSRGDRICGVVHGANLVNEEDGAFADYLVAKGDVQMLTPDSLVDEDAATIPLGAITVGQGLYQKSLQLALPTNPTQKGENVLIYGGGTATGGLAIQYAKLSGYTVITICSTSRFEHVKDLGADHMFDYNSADIGGQIRALTNNSLKYAWDTIGDEASAKICADSLTPDKDARYGTISPVKFPRHDVESSAVVMYTMFGEAFTFGPREFEASEDDFEFAKSFMSLTERLLAEGKLKTHPAIVRQGGLGGILKGLAELQAGRVRGGKLVYTV